MTWSQSNDTTLSLNDILSLELVVLGIQRVEHIQ